MLELPPPLPVLVTGVAGVAGYNAFQYFHAKWPGQVVGIRQESNDRVQGPGILGANVEDRDALGRLFARHEFAAVLNCAGNCALKPCELDPQFAWTMNVEGIRNLLRCKAPGARLIHLSCDLVFSGQREGGYTEEDRPDPVTVYGKTVVAGEENVLAGDPAACVLRISLPMGVSPGGHAGAIDWITWRFKRNLPATLFFDEIRTPTYTDCLNGLFERLLAEPLAGLYHAGGPRLLSLYEIAQIVNRVGGYAPELLHRLSRHHAATIPPRAGNVAMDSSKLTRALGANPFSPWPLDPALVPTHRDWHWERPAGQRGSPAWLHETLCLNRPRERAAG